MDCGDVIITDALVADALVYAQYSAGPCVLAPTLCGLDAVDDPAAGPEVTGPAGSGSALTVNPGQAQTGTLASGSVGYQGSLAPAARLQTA